jgi:hypothetical protein
LTVCIPAWNGELFIRETLESVRMQTVDDMRVLISVDKSDDRTLETCMEFAEQDSRFRVFPQMRRLGWAQNVNWLLRRVESEFASIIPHDDVISPLYLERLVAELRQRPEAVLAFCDMATFGEQDGIRTGPEVQGDLFTRILCFLSTSTMAEAWRGVFRSDVLQRAGYHEEMNGAAADQVWLLRLVVEGCLIRVPETLYRKRLHARSVVSAAFDEWGRPNDTHWVDHCVSCHNIAMAADRWTDAQRQAIAFAVLMRVVSRVRVGSEALMTALLADVSDYTLRLCGLIPPSTRVLEPADLPRQLTSYLESELKLPWARLDVSPRSESPDVESDSEPS